MVKVTGPMMSFDASGALADTVVFSRWKGRPYVRQRVIPSNPKSGGQVGMRAMLSWLAKEWDGLATADKATWDDRADSADISSFNAYSSYNLLRWRNFTAPSQVYPEATADVAPTEGTLAAAAGVRSITVTQPITTAADGWGIAFFRSTTASMTSAFDNLVAIRPISGTDDVVFVDSPLAVGTYYYVVRSITKDGQLGTQSSEVSATIS